MNRLNLTIPKIVLFVIVITFHLFIYRSWIFNTDLLTDGDWMPSFTQHSKELMQIPTAWKSDFLGNVNITPTFFPFQYIEGVLSNLELNYAMIERILFIWPIVFLSPVWILLLLSQYSKNYIAILMGVFVYLYNTYFLIIQTGHLTLMMAYSLTPLAMYIFERALKSNLLAIKINQIILCGIILFAISFYEFRAFYLVGLILFVRLFFEIFPFFVAKRNIKKLITSSTIIFVPFLIAMLLNSYWIFSMPFLGDSLTGVIQKRTLFGDAYFTLLNSLTLFHPFWTGSNYYPFIVQDINPLYLSLPIIALLGFLLKKKKIAFFYLAILILGIFLSKQTAPPIGEAYRIFYQYFPGFSFFREASKFYMLVALGYSVLITLSLTSVFTLKKIRLVIRLIPLFLILFLTISNVKPLIFNEMGMLFQPKHYPKEYQLFTDELYQSSDYFRTLWIPIDSRWSYSDSLHPKLSLLSLLSSTWSEHLTQNVATASDQVKVGYFFLNPNTPQLLSENSIKYLAVPSPDNINRENVFQYYGNRNEFISVLDNTSFAERITQKNKNEGVIYYELKDNLPKITLNSNLVIEPEVKYIQRKNDAEYSVIIDNVSGELTLLFSEKYHPGWRMRIGEFIWYESLFDPNYFVDKQFHSKSKFGLNEFEIQAREFCEKYNCDKTSNDSFSIHLTLYFEPQNYVNLGLLLSLTVGLVIILVLISTTTYILSKNIKNRRRFSK